MCGPGRTGLMIFSNVRFNQSGMFHNWAYQKAADMKTVIAEILFYNAKKYFQKSP